MVRNLLAMNRLKMNLEYQCILRMPMQHGNEDLTKIVMVYFESFSPKKTDLAKVTPDKLTEALMLINNRPRKCLGFKTPFDLFKHEIRKLI